MIKNLREKFKDLTAPAGSIVHVYGWGDYLSAALVGLAFFLVACLWSYPELHPHVWNETVAAAGLRPYPTLAGGVWRGFAELLFEHLGFTHAAWILRLLGRFAGAISVSIVFMILRCLLLSQIDVPLRSVIRWRWIFRGLIGLAALMFGWSDPVWQVFLQFGPEAFTILFSLLAVWLLLVFLKGSGRWTLQLSFLVLGLVAAETPVGLLVALMVVVLCMRARYLAIDPTKMLFDPLMTQQIKWRLTFMFLLGFAAAVSYDVYAYIASQGLAASRCEGGEVVFLWLREWWQALIGLGNASVWCLGAAVALAPFAMSLLITRKATDMEHFLPYQYAGFFLIAGCVAMLQLAGIPQCWFWTWNDLPDPMATSGVLRTFFMFICAANMELALSVAGVETWCRDYRHVAARLSSDPIFDFAPEKTTNGGRAKVASWMRYSLLFVVPLAALASSLLARRGVDERRIQYLMLDFVDETLRECGSASTLFTDGVFDALIELRAGAAKKPFHPISLMAERSPYNTYIAQRAAHDPEDREVLEKGPLAALRLWARDKRARMSDIALQLGFETWKHDEKSAPTVLGVVANGGVVPKEEQERARKIAHELSARVLAFYTDASGNPRKRITADPALRFLLEGMQWRLARIASRRSSTFEAASVLRDAVVEADLAKKLDDANVSYLRLREHIDTKRRNEEGLVLTPREGLEVTLKRRDFFLARRYAVQVLTGDPEDTKANYAMGMSNLAEENWTEAVMFFERVLKRKPNDASIMNNIAVAKWKDRKFEEAMQWCERAAKEDPDDKGVQSNLAKIRKDFEDSKKK